MARLQQNSEWMMLLGLLLALAGGLHVRGEPDGIWLRVGPLHLAGALVGLGGSVLRLVAGFRGGVPKGARKAGKSES